MDEVLREIGVTGATYDRWRKEYGGLGLDQARRLKDLEQENARLKRVAADLSLGLGSCLAKSNWKCYKCLAYNEKSMQ